MINYKMHEQIMYDELKGEKLICIFRLSLAIIYIISVPIVSVLRNIEGYSYLPWRAHTWNNVFFIYSILLYFYVRKKQILHYLFKYFSVVMDVFILSASISVICTYPEVAPPVMYISILVLFYSLLILAGALRYSVRSAYFSGILSSIGFLLVVIVHRNAIDLPYFFELNGKEIAVSFPIYNEFFRVIGMLVTGFVTGMACKRRLALLTGIIQTEAEAAETSKKIVNQTRGISNTIQESTNEIFISSKDIFNTANNQATSIYEIKNTINENSSNACEIADKIQNISNIASKTEHNVVNGFSLLERNVTQMEIIKGKNDGVISGILELGNKITQIRELINNINIITEQTKVIAFNAALEAASAEEQGKRFSVVANEVNRLANDIAVLTNKIQNQIEEIQNSSSSLIVSGKESENKIVKGILFIKELEELFNEIRSGAELTVSQVQTIFSFTKKQQQSTAQINTAIADISSGLSNFIHSTKAATASAEDLTQITCKFGDMLKDNINTYGGIL